MADGVTGPVRRIEGNRTLLARTMHGIVYDEKHDEIIVTQAFSQGVLTFRGGANGEEAPIRIIQGSRTQFKAPDRVALDLVNNEIFVGERGYILVFPRDANGNVAPIRRLEGPDLPNGLSQIAVDPVRNLLIVGGGGGLRIYNRTDSGNVKPKAMIGGPKSGFRGPNGPIAVHLPTGMIVASRSISSGVQPRDSDDGGGAGAGSGQINNQGEIVVFSVDDRGDVPPRLRIGTGFLKVPRGIGLDPASQNVVVSDKIGNRIVTFHVPEVFTTNSTQ
jgi:hypothetical protein